MVEKGHDVDRLINEWHRVFTLGALVATLPWLLNPIITNRFLKPFLMPSKRHGTGSGHVMAVSGDFSDRPIGTLVMTDYVLSRMGRCSNTVSTILVCLVLETCSTGKQSYRSQVSSLC